MAANETGQCGCGALARLGPLMTEAKPAKDPIHIAACVDNSGFPSLYILLQSLKVTQNNNELHVSESWPGKSAQTDKWIFCLTAAKIAAQEEIP